MQITNDVSQAVGANGTTPPAGTTTASKSPTANSTTGMASEQTFLQLLVAQIKNQDPMSPTDSMQFVTQLAQFSSLEQLIGINQGVNALNSHLPSTGATTPTGGTGANPPAGQ